MEETPAEGAAPRSQSPAIRCENVSIEFGGARALKGVSFDVGRGEVHCLAGENGCGKSTLIKIITGVYKPAAGSTMEYFGEHVSGMTPNGALQRGIGVIWQDLALFPEMTVAENIAFEQIVSDRRALVSQRKLRATALPALNKLGVDLDLDARLSKLPIAH